MDALLIQASAEFTPVQQTFGDDLLIIIIDHEST
jgi:hypothetical protein